MAHPDQRASNLLAGRAQGARSPCKGQLLCTLTSGSYGNLKDSCSSRASAVLASFAIVFKIWKIVVHYFNGANTLIVSSADSCESHRTQLHTCSSSERKYKSSLDLPLTSSTSRATPSAKARPCSIAVHSTPEFIQNRLYQKQHETSSPAQIGRTFMCHTRVKS